MELTEKVTATIKTNKKVNKVDGWTLSSDGKTLTKTYSENKTETVNLVDEDGLKKGVEVKINNITKLTETNAENKTEDKKSDMPDNVTGKKADQTVTSETKLPQTGANLVIVSVIAMISTISIITYNKTKKYKGIK